MPKIAKFTHNSLDYVVEIDSIPGTDKVFVIKSILRDNKDESFKSLSIRPFAFPNELEELSPIERLVFAVGCPVKKILLTDEELQWLDDLGCSVSDAR